MTGGAPRDVLIACDATRALATLGPRATTAVEALDVALHLAVLLAKLLEERLDLLVALLVEQGLLVDKLLNLLAAVAVTGADFLNFALVTERKVFN